MDSTLKRILLVGHDNRLYHEILKEAVEIGINDGAISKAEACEILDNFSLFDDVAAKRIGDKYMMGKVVRHDISVGLRWYYIAAQKGNSIAAGYLAGIIGAEAVSEINDEGHSNVAMELLCAAAWWGNVAFAAQPFTKSEDALGANVLGEKWSPRDLAATQTRRLVAGFIEDKRQQFTAKTREERIKSALDSARADAEAARSDAAKAAGVNAKKGGKFASAVAKVEAWKAAKDESEQDAKITKAIAEFHSELEAAGDDGDDVLDVSVSVSIREVPTHVVAIDGVSTQGRTTNSDIKDYVHLATPLPVPMIPDDLDAVEAMLMSEFPYADRVIGTVVKDMKLRRAYGNEAFVIKPTLLVGPPGIGKTRLAKRLAQAVDCPFDVFAAAGSADNRDFDGTSKGYNSATPSFVARFLSRACMAGGMVVVDEIDKVSSSNHNGSILDSLINCLEGQNAYNDGYLQSKLDLSACSFILTANKVDHLPLPLLNRCRLLEVGKPKPEHVPAIVKGIVADIAFDLGVHPAMIEAINGHEMDALVSLYRKSVSIRSLRRGVERILEIRERTPITH